MRRWTIAVNVYQYNLLLHAVYTYQPHRRGLRVFHVPKHDRFRARSAVALSTHGAWHIHKASLSVCVRSPYLLTDCCSLSRKRNLSTPHVDMHAKVVSALTKHDTCRYENIGTSVPRTRVTTGVAKRQIRHGTRLTRD